MDHSTLVMPSSLERAHLVDDSALVMTVQTRACSLNGPYAMLFGFIPVCSA